MRLFPLLLSPTLLCMPLEAIAQSSGATSSRWSVSAFGGLSQQLSQDRLHSGFGVGLGLRHRLGDLAGISIEATYLPLGAQSDRSPYQSLLNPELRGTQSSSQARKLLRLGLNLDLPLTRGTVRPSLLAGVDAAWLHSKRSNAITDTAGTVVSATRFDGWGSGLGGHVGAALTLPGIGPLQPIVESRLYGFAFRDELTWSALPVLTAGLSITF